MRISLPFLHGFVHTALEQIACNDVQGGVEKIHGRHVFPPANHDAVVARACTRRFAISEKMALIAQRSEQHQGIFVIELVSLAHLVHGRKCDFAKKGLTVGAQVAIHSDLSSILKADGARFGIQQHQQLLDAYRIHVRRPTNESTHGKKVRRPPPHAKLQATSK